MSKVITPHFEKLIDRFVASGRFNNKSEVIRAGLRLLEEHEANAAAASRDDLSRIIETALMDRNCSDPGSAPAPGAAIRRPRRMAGGRPRVAGEGASHGARGGRAPQT